MIVYVEAHDLQPGGPPGRQPIDDVRTVADVWMRLRSVNPDQHGGQATGVAVLVNGRLATWQTVLQDGDVVRLIPAPGGG